MRALPVLCDISDLKHNTCRWWASWWHAMPSRMVTRCITWWPGHSAWHAASWPTTFSPPACRMVWGGRMSHVAALRCRARSRATPGSYSSSCTLRDTQQSHNTCMHVHRLLGRCRCHPTPAPALATAEPKELWQAILSRGAQFRLRYGYGVIRGLGP